MKKSRKITVPRLIKMKKDGQKITALTAYDATLAKLEDTVGLDIILVGDSAGMVISGAKDTISITLDDMLFLTRSVRKGVRKALLVADMPFGSYNVSEEKAIEAALRFMKEGGAEAVKMEGAGFLLPTITRMTSSGIPVMGHLGLTPQSVHSLGGFVLRGGSKEEADKIIEDALALEKAGVFAIVLEKIPTDLARTVTEAISIPTIGIASGPHCDGQILVSYDLLGLGEFEFKFVRKYFDGTKLISEALQRYISDVRSGSFPSDKESY